MSSPPTTPPPGAAAGGGKNFRISMCVYGIVACAMWATCELSCVCVLCSILPLGRVCVHLCHRHLDSGTRKLLARATVKVAFAYLQYFKAASVSVPPDSSSAHGDYLSPPLVGPPGP